MARPLRPSRRASQSEDLVPEFWYNIIPDLPKPLSPPLLPDGRVPPREMFERLFAKSLVEQEFSYERFVRIPEAVRSALISLGRPTPLIRARRLEELLGTKARIYYKYEGVLPTGSHKVNTAVAQAYYNSVEGVERLSTETGAGQWGSALSLAGALFKLKVRVFMVRSSYEQKPYRRVLMELYGAEVIPSPSRLTKVGLSVLERDPSHPGSLGIAISEAIEDVLSDERARYSLGSVLNHVLLHQTVIGLEALNQLEEFGEELPDYVIGCVGGGSNYAGLAYPFLRFKLSGKKDIRFIAVEPRACPSLTRGVYTYDYGDTAGLTPLLKMYTVGHRYKVPPIHAGGLRYHGDAPSLCLLASEGLVEARAYHQREVFEAGAIFARTEGIVPAPESAHAVKAAIDIALEAKDGESPVILFNLSGHGLLDLQGYLEYLEGRLLDYEPVDIDLSYLPKVNV
jgi:tryptophan synthase beta chain